MLEKSIRRDAKLNDHSDGRNEYSAGLLAQLALRTCTHEVEVLL